MTNSMMHKITIGLFFYLSLTCTAWSQSNRPSDSWQSPHSMEKLTSAPAALIPFPREVSWSKDLYDVPNEVGIIVEADQKNITASGIRSLQELLNSLFIKSRLVIHKQGDPLPAHSILFASASTKPEGYHLSITKTGVKVEAADAAGFYYAVQTIRQLLLQAKDKIQLPGCTIADWPAFPLRGLMHDNGRNFQSIPMLKEQLERLSRYKFNTFHWHLTDNPAWRPESRLYPQLNDPKNREEGRDPDSTYSFEDIRELIRFARERNITIIPELDMPGHSKYFEPTFGFKMESEKGMQVLEKLIDEFCAEIPASDCPIIHLGSDEVRIPNPKEFIQRMTNRVKANNRKVMVWNPGLPPAPGTIEQMWREDNTRGVRSSDNPYVDSYGGYLNNYDVYSLVQRYFFQQICNKPEGDSTALGGIVCLWPDVRVDDKSRIALQSALWPGALTYIEAAWCGRPGFNPEHINALPGKETRAFAYFREFEKRLSTHRDRFFAKDPFPYVQFGNSEWTLKGIYHRQKTDSASQAFAPERHPEQDTGKTTLVTGGILQMSIRTEAKALAVDPDETVYLRGYIYVPAARNIHAILGFEAAARSHRRGGGIPQNGKWDANGGAVFINRKELAGPAWATPGGYRYLQSTWHQPPNELPFTDEEFFWTRPPAGISLKKGWNEILVRVPRAYRDQRWMFAFVPVKKNAGGKWVEDLSVEIRSVRK